MSSEGIEAWVESTTAFDRVRSVVMTVDEPKSSAYISDEAHVAENTARSHLARLADLGIVLAVSEGRVTRYYPEPLYTRMQMLRELFGEYEHDELIDRRVELREYVDKVRDQYGMENPTAMRREAAEAEAVEEIRELKKTASEWEHAMFRLSVVEDAIRLYDSYAESIPRGSEQS